jgi:ribosomal protein S12
MNSEKRIIYKSSNGLVRVLVPADNTDMTVEEIAQKDVPTGVKYKIVDVSEISSDRSFRNAWDIDEAELTDGTGADYGVSED